MARTPILLAVDGNSLAIRAFHAYHHTHITTSSGRDQSTVFGFITLLIGICAKTHPDAVVVGFDDQRTSLRRQLYPLYKAQRGAQTSQIFRSIADIYLLLSKIAIATVIPPGLEADDVLASAAQAAETYRWLCVLATSDRDSFSLISPTTTVLRLNSGLKNAKRLTPSDLQELYGVTPEQYLGYSALRGDVSDNLPGISGIGEKTAAKIMQSLGSTALLKAQPSDLAALLPPALATKLALPSSQEIIQRNLDLMSLASDLPLNPDQLRLICSPTKVQNVLKSAEFPTLVKRAVNAFCPKEQTPSHLAK